MFMSMMSAMQPYFQSNISAANRRWKAEKIAIIACVRKMVVILNSMVRDGVYWDPKMN